MIFTDMDLAMRFFFRIAVVFLALSGLAKADDLLKIGVVVPVTGPFASNGMTFLNGAKSEVYQINEAGGINGKQVELVIADSFCDPSKAKVAAETLIQREEVLATIERSCGAATTATAQVFGKNDVFHLVFSEDAAQATRIGASAGSVWADDSVNMQKMAKAFTTSKVAASVESAAGYTAIELLIQGITSSNSYESKKIRDHLFSKPAKLDAGSFIGLATSNSNSVLFDIWAEKKGCPKCPKSGECPQEFAQMVEKKKKCK